MTNWHKFRRLTCGERYLLLQAALMLPATALALRSVGLKRWQRILTRVTRTTLNFNHHNGNGDELTNQAVKTVARLVRAAANHGIYQANCLEQSLVLWYLLRRAGFASEIRYGARKQDTQLHAHAWVECLGLTLNEDRGVEQRFAPFNSSRMNSTLASSLRQDL